MYLSVSIVMTSTDEGHLHMKEKFEVIRNQLGPSWLKSLEIHQSSGERNGENATTETRDSVIVHCSETSQTSQVVPHGSILGKIYGNPDGLPG